MSTENNRDPALNWWRRKWLKDTGCGFAALGLAALLGEANTNCKASDGLGARANNPLAPVQPHFKASAKRVVWIFVNGGPSQVDTWDYKPELPGIFQGTHLKPTSPAIDNLQPPNDLSVDSQRQQLNLLKQLNQWHLDEHSTETDLAARIESFELAYRMQSAAPETLDLSQEPEHIHKLYGIDDPECDHIARQCLMARRFLERGVRFVQIYSGGMENQRSWDGHSDIEGNHRQFAGETDKPVAALLTDLHQRGMLDDTLVIWCGEFGRLPIAQIGGKPGRDHNPHCFTAWLAGGGVRGGISYGQSDEIGYKAALDRVHLNDLHATILHLLGLDHEKLTYRYNGRDFRLTDVAGKVIHPLLAV
ncbi:MAG: DUF1501 domain-containing protein [Pirellulales bacterium]